MERIQQIGTSIVRISDDFEVTIDDRDPVPCSSLSEAITHGKTYATYLSMLPGERCIIPRPFHAADLQRIRTVVQQLYFVYNSVYAHRDGGDVIITIDPPEGLTPDPVGNVLLDVADTMGGRHFNV